MRNRGKAGNSEADNCDSSRLGDRYIIWSEKVRCSSTIKPRFRAEWELSSEELRILSSWFLSPMSKNSVLEELRVKRFAVIQEVRKRSVEERFEGEKCLSQS